MALVEMFKYWGYDSLETGTHPDGTPIYDRAIDSADVALYNELLYTSGIDKNYEDCFKIVPGAGLSIIRKPGHASLGGRPALDPNPQTVTLAAGNTYYYVMESNAEIEYRMAREGVLLATETSIPPQRDENHYQIILALITVPSGVSQITAEMITDLRLNKDYCGLITINANYDFEELLITANDIQDTDTKFIPSRTGDGSLVLHNDGYYKKVASAALGVLESFQLGEYSIAESNGIITIRDSENNEVLQIRNDRIKMGDYTAIRNGNDIDISYVSSGTSNVVLPLSHEATTHDNLTITNLDNSLNPSSNNTYATIAHNRASQRTVFAVIFTYNNPTIYASATNIAIALKIKGRQNRAGTSGDDTRKIGLYNLDTNEIIPGTEQAFTAFGTEQTVRTINYNFNSLDEIGTSNIGVKMTLDEYSGGSPYLATYIYGSDLTITQAFDGIIIGKFTPDGIITSPGGTVQTMMTQGILDNTQDILLLKEGIDI